MTLEVGYWNLRGLVGDIRLIDVYTQEGVKWVNYGIAERDQWLAEKSNNEHGLGKTFRKLCFKICHFYKTRLFKHKKCQVYT